MTPELPATTAPPVSRRGFMVLAAGGIGGILASVPTAAFAATPDPSPKLPNEYFRKANQVSTTGVLFDDISVRVNGDSARMFIPQTIKPYTTTPTLVVWLFHGAGSDHNAIVGGFKSTATAVVNAGGIAICQNAGGTLYSHPTAQALQVAGYSYLSSLYTIDANVLRATSGGGALAYETYGSQLIPNIIGMYHVNSAFDILAMYNSPTARDSVIAAFGDDPAAIAAANPARLASSAWAGKKGRVVVSQPNSSDLTVPPATNGLQFLAIASSTAAEASLRTHTTGHSTPTFADTDFIASLGRWRTPVADTSIPQVKVTAPAAASTATGTVTLTAAALDNLNVSTVTFLVGGVSVPARLNVDSVLVPGSAGATAWIATLDSRRIPNGAATLTATAVDPSGNSATSLPVALTVRNSDTTAPTVAVVAPAPGATVQGTIALRATAADDFAVASVTFAVGAATVPATLNATTGEWTATFNTVTVPDGALTVAATAADAAGNTTTSPATIVTVKNADTTAPVVTIVSPASGSTVKGVVTAKASASDDRGVTGVAYYASGRLIGNATLTADGLWTLAFNTKTSVTPNGTYLVTAKAMDAAGNVGTSAATTILIKN
jgi:hypothetical protein